MSDQNKYLAEADASARLREHFGIRCGHSKLSKMRCTGGGPLFRKVGNRIVYKVTDLDEWAKSRISAPMRSTSDFVRSAEGSEAAA